MRSYSIVFTQGKAASQATILLLVERKNLLGVKPIWLIAGQKSGSASPFAPLQKPNLPTGQNGFT
ncbi:hypothetical protein C8255_24580 [filamentous cyanobacterium CCP3]|nr:hypothetical protein C8255_24580 [filamentous cyanobacterium CCP3]